MKRDSRLSLALHVLLHLADADHPLSSEQLGPMMNVNPVVLRRTLGGLRDAGIVASAKGHGGGWSLSRPLAAITVADVYEALGTPAPFRIGHRQPEPRCLLERAVNRALDDAMSDAEALLIGRLRQLTLQALAAEFGPAIARHHAHKEHEPHV
ncbi:MAG: Rrf2 family transcriptional regulator [Myxococcales bacterium]|nr:Rrf2 family transcriptional regulator [Myxococcales bacterium]